MKFSLKRFDRVVASAGELLENIQNSDMEKNGPWKKHPAITINTTSNRGVISQDFQQQMGSKLPVMSGKRHQFEAPDKIPLSTNPVQERAKNIILSQMKIVSNSGKVRVARNQESAQPENAGGEHALPSGEGKENNSSANLNSLQGSAALPFGDGTVRKADLSTGPSTSASFGSTELPLPSTPANLFAFSTALQRTSYEFKPPAAAKYFLWDNARIGPTLFSSPKDFIYSTVKITSPSLKSLRMEILKAGLLSRSNSTLSPPSILGVLMGKPVWNTETSLWDLDLDRFEAGEKATGSMEGDVLVHCVWSEVVAKEGFNYILLLEKLKSQQFDSPLANLTTTFPIFAHFCSLEGGEVSVPSCKC